MPLSKDFKFLSVPKILSGKNSLENISVELAGFGCSSPLVIMDKNYRHSGADKKLIKSFGASSITKALIYNYAGTSAGIDVIKKITGLYRSKNCDSIIAAGSGPVMDAARGANIIISTGNENILQYSGTGNIPCKLKPMVSIPLPVLYGNETSNTALIDGVKYLSDFLYPDIIITDPRLSALAPKDSILESALSILSVSIDSVLSPRGNPVRNFYLYSAIDMVCGNLENIHGKPGNKKIKTAIVNAGAIAGAACDASYPGFITSAGLALSKETGLSIGTSLGIILPHALEYAFEHHGPHDSGLLLPVTGHDIFSLTPEKQRGEVAAVMIKSWIQGNKSRIPVNLKKIKFPDYKIQSVSENAEFLSGGNYRSSEFLSVFTSAMESRTENKYKEKMSFDLDKIIKSTFDIDK